MTIEARPQTLRGEEQPGFYLTPREKNILQAYIDGLRGVGQVGESIGLAAGTVRNNKAALAQRLREETGMSIAFFVALEARRGSFEIGEVDRPNFRENVEQCARLVARGLARGEIAAVLNVPYGTIKNRFSEIYFSVGANNFLQAVAILSRMYEGQPGEVENG